MITSLFSLNGRVSRPVYWCRYFCVLPIINLSNYLLLLNSRLPFENWMVVLLWLIFIFSVYFVIAQSVQRLHDINRNGWYALIPIYGLILSLKKGDIEENSFGQVPSENSSIFSFSGKVGILEWFYSCLYLGAINVLVILSFSIQLNGISDFYIGSHETISIAFAYLILYFNYLFGIVLSIKRLNDVGKNGWYILIPIYGIILLFYPSIKADEVENNSSTQEKHSGSFYLLMLLIALFIALFSYTIFSVTSILSIRSILSSITILVFELVAILFLNGRIIEDQSQISNDNLLIN